MIVYLLYYAIDYNCVLFLNHLGHFTRLLYDVILELFIMFIFDTYTLTLHYTVYTE